MADLLEFQGANPFRIRAYRNGARTIQDLPEPVEAILEDPARRLTEVKGIGKDLAEKIADLVSTGTTAILDELLAEIPETVLALLRVPGLGPKRAAVLHRELGINTLDQLRQACQSGQVRQIKGFGAKTEASILENLEIAEERESEPIGDGRRDRRGLKAHLSTARGQADRAGGQLSPRTDTVGT